MLLLQVWSSTDYHKYQNCCKQNQSNVRSNCCSGSSDACIVLLATLLCVVLAATSNQLQIAAVLKGEQQRRHRQRGGFCLSCTETQVALEQRPVSIERRVATHQYRTGVESTHHSALAMRCHSR